MADTRRVRVKYGRWRGENAPWEGDMPDDALTERGIEEGQLEAVETPEEAPTPKARPRRAKGADDGDE